MRCLTCRGLIVHHPAYAHYPARDVCQSCGREPNMSYNLDPEKEEEVKTLLKTDSIREIVKKTGVAKNTIARIRNKSFTDQERADLKKLANVKGRHKRETAIIPFKQPEINLPEKVFYPIKKEETDEEIIASTNCAVGNIDVIKSMLQEKDPKWTFDDIAKKQQELLKQKEIEIQNEIKRLMAEAIRIQWRLCGLDEYLQLAGSANEETDEVMEDLYKEQVVDDWNEKSKK